MYELTGKQLSSFEYKSGEGQRRGPYDAQFFRLTIPRETLHAQLESRVHAQLACGLLEEVRAFYEGGYGPELPAMKGITYRQLLGCLRGEYDCDTAVELMVRDNRRYARRQFTWFKADPRIRWIEILECRGPEAAGERIVEMWHASGGIV